MGRFTGFGKCVVLRVSEAKDLSETDHYSFYERMKTYTAAPPNVLRVNEKNLREYYVLNCCGVVLTTNHKTSGIYLPANDRRNYVACFGAGTRTAGLGPEDAELADVIDQLGRPKAFTLNRLRSKAVGTPIFTWLDDRKNIRAIPHRLENCKYVPVRNDVAEDGRWKIKGARQTVYARQDLSVRERNAAAVELTRERF